MGKLVQPGKKGHSLFSLALISPKERCFVDAYLGSAEFNAAKAAEVAGYKGVSAASRLLNKKSVQTYMAKSMKERNDRCEVDADAVLMEVYKRALADPGLLIDDDGQLRPLKDMPIEIRRNLSLEFKDGSKEITKLSWDRNDKAIELLFKHLGLLNDTMKVEHSVSNDVVTKLLLQVEDQRSNVVDGEVIELEVKGE